MTTVAPIRAESLRRRRKIARRHRLSSATRSLVGAIILALLLYPVYWLVNASLQSGASAASITSLPLAPSLGAYGRALDDQFSNIVTSLVVAVGTAVLSVAIAAPAAFGLSRLRSRFVDVVLITLFIAQIVPGIVLANSLYTMFDTLGLLNSYFGLMLANASGTLPFAILLLRAFMRELDPELLEAARLDGAGNLRTFAAIVLPLSRNALITAGIFGFLAGWGDFLFALTLTTGSDLRTMSIGIFQYIGSPNVEWSAVMAAGVLASIPAIVLLLLLQRYLKAGLAQGSGK
ncbi:MAG: carbohydrate transporter permease [Microbacterium sp.]|jgi:multiple sugar transport system permease protein|uniref:carbohydrate ABC transporter permease n=1 Tax=Microbacterium sp. TaxID=51671 RepID=UPI002626332F|nr:carbohydrate ABC transporter permease [Microbacterium sp.]MDF2562176.1 carbohydrate transporter permease [Microbacterium sp.]